MANDPLITLKTGPVGPQGIQGETGLDGADGADSTVPGPEGPQGAAGAKGDTGPAGADGADSTVPGPEGPAGADGVDGAPGAKGDTGAAGADGVDGAVGPKGDTGAAGPAGADGADGDTMWATHASGIYYDVGNVAIGSADPSTLLTLGSISSAPSADWAGGTDQLKLHAIAGSSFSEPCITFQEAGLVMGAKIGVKNKAEGAYDIIFANRGTTDTEVSERIRIDNGGRLICSARTVSGFSNAWIQSGAGDVSAGAFYRATTASANAVVAVYSDFAGAGALVGYASPTGAWVDHAAQMNYTFEIKGVQARMEIAEKRIQEQEDIIKTMQTEIARLSSLTGGDS